MKIGVLGGGQLGRMLALAGHNLGFTFRFLDPSPEAPARHVGELVVGDWNDGAALERFAQGLDVVTYEFENVPAAAVHRIAQDVPVFPPVPSLEISQDRLCEKALFNSLGISTAQYAPVSSLDDLDAAVDRYGAPGILKTRRAGYDGKGQARIGHPAETAAAWTRLAPTGAPELIYERFIEFDREVSVIGVRDAHGNGAFYPLSRNTHADGMLRVSLAPDGDAPIERAAHDAARSVMDHLRHVGVLTIEFFVVRRPDGGHHLVANELAPRVHNSGHWTIEGAVTSQFENHLRAIAGLPLGHTAMMVPGWHAAMLNLIGRSGDLGALLEIPGSHVHLYAKHEREGRKIGHVTFLGASEAGLLPSIARAAVVAGQRLT